MPRANEDMTVALHLAQDFCVGSLPSLNDSRQTEIIAIVTIMMVASTVSVILRMVARQMSSAKYGLDDVLIIIALVRFMRQLAIRQCQIHNGNVTDC